MLQLLRITKETTFGVFPTSPATGTQTEIFLPQGDAFTVRVMPQQTPIRDAGQGNRRVRMINGRQKVQGSLATMLFPTQAPLLLGLAAGLTGSAPCYDLPSFACDHLIYTDNACATIYRRYLGCKFARATLACNDSDNGFLMSFNGDIIASTAATITGTDFPTPSLSTYPGEDPYEFYHTAEATGALVIGSTRHDYYNLSIDISNTLVGFGGESRTTQRVAYEGRDIGITVELLLKSNADRAAYEANTKQAVSVKFDNGVNTCLFDFGAQVNIDGVTDQLPLGNKYTQRIAMSSLMDPVISSDLAITLT